MIAKSVEELSDRFVYSWSQTVSASPRLVLDGTWPSVGVLDLLTFPLRGYAQFSPVDERLIKVCAAYLAVITHECWLTFTPQVVVDEGEKGIYIRATDVNSPSASKDFEVSIENELKRILAAVPNPFPVLADFSRPISNEQNILSLFTLGLVTGLTPFGDGAWLTETTDTFKENIQKVVTLLARTAADHYGRLYPGEELGQVGELYLNGLIYPPILMNEELPAIAAVRLLGEFFTEYRVSPAAMAKVCHNLALLPDDQISQVGLVFYAALCEEMPPLEILAVAETRGRYMGLLRSATVDVREMLGLRAEWITSGEFTPEDGVRFEIEMAMGMLPWVKLSKAAIREKKRNPKLLPLLEALNAFNLDDSIKACEEIISEMPGELEYRIQRIYLDLVCGDFERGCVECRKLLSEPGAETSSSFFNLWGLCELCRDNLQDAERFFANAERNKNAMTQLEAEQIANNHAWSLMLLERYEEALEVLEGLIPRALCRVTPLLNKAYVLRLIGRHDEAERIQEELLKLSPLDRRVFGNLLSRAGSPRPGER